MKPLAKNDYPPAEIVERLDTLIAEMTRLRSDIARTIAPAQDDREPVWVDTWSASERFNLPIDTVRWLAREKGLGRKECGRWMVDVEALRKYRSSD